MAFTGTENDTEAKSMRLLSQFDRDGRKKDDRRWIEVASRAAAPHGLPHADGRPEDAAHGQR